MSNTASEAIGKIRRYPVVPALHLAAGLAMAYEGRMFGAIVWGATACIWLLLINPGWLTQ